MKKTWKSPQLKNLTTKDTYTNDDHVLCNNSICISKCEVCGGCLGSNTKVQQCSYYKRLAIKNCLNAEKGGCKLPIS
ncbi:MAG: hypothetical protein RR128_09875 [Clostridium sp.]